MISDREKAAALSNLSELVVCQDLENRVTWANKAAGESVGVAAEELVGHYCYEIWHQRSEVCDGCPIVEARENGQTREAEVTTPDGRVYLLRGDPIKDADGNVVGIVEVGRDITERKRAEEALEESQARLSGILDSAKDVIVSVDEDQRITLFNQGAEKTLGYQVEEVIGKPLDILLPERFVEAHRKHIQDFATSPSSPRPMTGDNAVTCRRKDGTEFPAESSVSKLKLDGQTIFTAILRDITERKQAEEALRESEENLKEAQRIARLGSFERDFVNDTVIYSDEIFRILGLTKDTYDGTFEAFLNILHPDDRELFKKAIGESHSENKPLEIDYRVVHPDGTERIVHSHAEVQFNESGEAVKLTGTLQDVTDRRRAEERMQESEAALMSIFLAAPIGIGTAKNRVIIQANDQLCEMLGYSCEELLDKEARMLYPTEEDYKFVGREKYAQIRQQGSGTVETKWQRKDGEVIDVLLSSSAFDPDDVSSGMIFTALDITERRRAEEALRESEERYRTLSDSSLDCIKLLDLEGRIVMCNDVALKVTGSASKEDLIGKKIVSFFSEEWQPVVEESIEKAIRGEPVRIQTSTPTSTRAHCWWDDAFISVRDGEGRVTNVLFTGREITERKRAEEALIQSEKLAALGRLTAGTTHEILNPLTVIGLIVQRLIENPTTPPEIADDLRDAKGQTQRIYKIVQNLLQFSRPHPVELKPVDLNEVIEQSLDLVEPDLRIRDVTSQFNLSEDLPGVLGDGDQLRQVLVNLLTNASDAMPNGGEIVVSTGTVDRQGKRFVELRVEDTGEGIASEEMDKLFEPFFTTKPVGEGTGLGLSVCRGIIESHGGSIWAENASGGGAIFFVQLVGEGE